MFSVKIICYAFKEGHIGDQSLDYLIKVWFVAWSKICVCKMHDEKDRESESCIDFLKKWGNEKLP